MHALASYVRSGSVQLFLNAGDHEHMKSAFRQALKEENLTYDTVDSMEGVKKFQEHLLTNPEVEPSQRVTMFAFSSYFPAVATTDILARVSDVLACKPSELAFYPLPKLMVRRVGDHEADSARRACELGDGTNEARTIEDAMKFVKLFLEGDDLMTQMNERIMENAKQGIYDGCKNAVKLALQRV